MPPVVIAYQSLNSNSSKTHDLSASTAQVFTRAAQRTMSGIYTSGSGALKYPTSSTDPHIAVQGPAQLVPVASADFVDARKPSLKRKRGSGSDDGGAETKKIKKETLSMVEGKALQIYQSSHRTMFQSCDLIVFGELDSTHPDWSALESSAGKRLHTSIQTKACNCFSMHSSSVAAKFIDQGTGWFAAECQGVIAVFVHVPNSLAANEKKAIVFYQGIKSKLLKDGGKIPDVFIGDTNQPREMFSPSVITTAMGMSFVNGHKADSQIKPVDTWKQGGAQHKGTNSANSKMFDVAVYNVATVKEIKVKYFTPLSHVANQAAAYTDHMGIMVRIEKR